MSTRILTFPPAGNRTLSWLLWKSYGHRVISGFTSRVLEQNPGLAEMGARPPGGTQITVTDPAPVTTTKRTRKVIRLYD